jgi:hypothetical protein
VTATYSNPTVSEFKTYFTRDFPYSADPNVGVTDTDIARAFGQTNMNVNPALFPTQGDYTIGYLLLAAHYLVIDLRMASQGISGQPSWLETSKSVGSVSQSFAVPQKIMDNPYLALLSKTNYGGKYLELILPQLAGAVFPTYGRTLP